MSDILKGKTQLAIQLAMDVQIPELFKGCDGKELTKMTKYFKKNFLIIHTKYNKYLHLR